MPRINLNLTEAESLKPIPEDAYLATVIECAEVAEGKKAHYVPVKLSLTGGEHEGRSFYVNLPIEGKGAGIFVDFINKCLNTDYDVDDMEDLAFDTADLIGAEVMLNITDQEWPEGSWEFRSSVKSTAKVS